MQQSERERLNDQERIIINHFQKYKTATMPELIKQTGSMNISARISDLRSKGWIIKRGKLLRRGIYLYELLGFKDQQNFLF